MNIRSSHSKKSKVIGQLSSPSQVYVVDLWQSGGELWYKVKTSQGKTGWMAGQFIKRLENRKTAKKTNLNKRLIEAVTYGDPPFSVE